LISNAQKYQKAGDRKIRILKQALLLGAKQRKAGYCFLGVL
jgi:hypothetical protein